jgi:hypothetical protein
MGGFATSANGAADVRKWTLAAWLDLAQRDRGRLRVVKQ